MYVLNRVISKTSPVTPYQNWYGSKPNLSHLRIFGSIAFIHVPKAERRKLDSKSLKCFFVGYSLTQKAYRFWDPVSRVIKISRDVVFDEQLYPTAPSNSTKTVSENVIKNQTHPFLPTVQMEPERIIDQERSNSSSTVNPEQNVQPMTDHIQTDPEHANSDTIKQPDFSNTTTRTRQSPYPMRKRVAKEIFEAQIADEFQDEDLYEPANYSDAMESKDSSLWKLAIADEYDSLIKNNTWTLTLLPPGRVAIKSRWLFKIKTGAEGTAPRYKARLVAKGYSQRSGIDYGETYAPVAKHDTLRVILSIVAAYDLEMIQLDINSLPVRGVK